MNECCKGCKIYNGCPYADLDKLECSYKTKDDPYYPCGKLKKKDLT